MKESKDSIPYYRLEKPGGSYKVVAPLEDFLQAIIGGGISTGIDEFDRNKQIVYFHCKVRLTNRFRILKLKWDVKTGKVSIRIFNSLYSQNKMVFKRQFSSIITHGYYGKGWSGWPDQDKECIWVPVVDISEILFGKYRNADGEIIPTCIFRDRRLVMIFTDAFTAPSKPYE